MKKYLLLTLLAGLYVGISSFVTPSPVYADYAKGCRKVCSPYRARTRCDGSTRSSKYPIHGGIDMAIPEGTPILATAAGIVINSKRGKSIGGIILTLKHPPKATGLKYYVFSQYKHLREKSPLSKGTKVRKGQKVAVSGKTGTVGGKHYKSAGFPHLHFETRKSSSGRLKDSTHMDPLSFLSAAGTRATWPCQ